MQQLLKFAKSHKAVVSKDQHLERVADKLRWHVAAFIQAIGVGREFTMRDLTHYVLDNIPNAAPDSPGRILRMLRKQEVINYVVISRRDSRYAVVPLPR